MKIALICDDLVQFGGAERVFLKACEMWPYADVFTSVVSLKWQNICAERGIKLHTSFLQKFPFAEKLNRVYSIFLLHIFAFESFDLSGYGLVISFSSRYAHFVITHPKTIHICYMHSPGRMFWEPYDYFEYENLGMFKSLKALLNLPISCLRTADFIAAQRVDSFIANSKTTQDRISKYYKRSSTIIHPFVDTKKFAKAVSRDGNYFLVVSRLVSWKRIDLAITTCNDLKLNLKVVGDGPDHARLRGLAGNTVDLLGRISEEEKIKLMSGCLALINTQKEDFGITPLEVMSCGKPVLAYKEGGALETVIPGKTGELFDTQDRECLSKMLASFDPKKYSREDCRGRAKDYDSQLFESKLQKFVEYSFSNKNPM
jgi:glycosyltransferase involved in cell wall biosynthesis